MTYHAAAAGRKVTHKVKKKSITAGETTGAARRKFLRDSVAAGAAAAFAPAMMAGARVEVRENARRDDANDHPFAETRAFELEEITIADLQEGMKSGKLTARSVTEKYLARIEALDARGPALRSVIETNPEALATAEALDKERKAKGPRGPLHGIPVLIKDNIDTADRMMTTAGSLALVGAKPPEDSFVVRRLRASGAVILGKTNPSEWANIRSSHATSGWSGRGGLTKNPYALDRNPCGSSSGTGAGISANMGAVGVGTETDGSIVCPSSSNGLVGIKPTVGLISRTGIIPISHTQDSAGPMCRTVRDAAILLGAMTGVDAEDAATAASAGKSFEDYTQFLTAFKPGMRVGVVRKYFGFNEGVDALMEQALDVLKKNGVVVVDPTDITTIGKTGDNETTVLLYELKADLNAYLARLGPKAPVKTLLEVIEFNDRNRAKEMPYFGQDMFLKAQAKGGLDTKEYLDALQNNLRLARQEGIDATMDKFKLDALVAPTGGPAWVTDLVNGDNAAGQTSTAAAVACYPSVSLPMGHVFGLPVGISFFGRAWSEPTLISLAYGFEQATKVRKAPKFLSTANLTA
jgi:amidase